MKTLMITVLTVALSGCNGCSDAKDDTAVVDTSNPTAEQFATAGRHGSTGALFFIIRRVDK